MGSNFFLWHDNTDLRFPERGRHPSRPLSFFVDRRPLECAAYRLVLRPCRTLFLEKKLGRTYPYRDTQTSPDPEPLIRGAHAAPNASPVRASAPFLPPIFETACNLLKERLAIASSAPLCGLRGIGQHDQTFFQFFRQQMACRPPLPSPDSPNHH